MKLRLACLLVFVVFWLVPFYLTGSMIQHWNSIYSRLRFQYSAAGLFTHRIPVWNQTLYQVRTTGVDEWKTIETAEISPMGAFGFRQRLDRIFQDTSNKNGMQQVRQRLAEWVAQEYGKRHPNEGAVLGVRIGQTYWTTDRKEMTQPAGEWIRDPVDIRPSSPFRPQATFTINKGKAVEEQMTRRTAAAATKPLKAPERKNQTTAGKGSQTTAAN